MEDNLSYAYADLCFGDELMDTFANYGSEKVFSVSLKYDFKDSALHGFSFGRGVYGATKRFGDLTNSYSDASYVRLYVFASYRAQLASSVMTTRLNINNVSDVEYYNLRSRWSNIPRSP